MRACRCGAQRGQRPSGRYARDRRGPLLTFPGKKWRIGYHWKGERGERVKKIIWIVFFMNERSEASKVEAARMISAELYRQGNGGTCWRIKRIKGSILNTVFFSNRSKEANLKLEWGCRWRHHLDQPQWEREHSLRWPGESQLYF